MTLVKFNRPTLGLQSSPMFSDLIENFFRNDFLSKEFAGFVPAVNISESEKAFHIELSAPGFSKGDFKIAIEKDVLSISAEHKTEKSEEDKNYTRKEFSYGSFKRSFTLPQTVDVERVEAKYEDGILKLNVSKKEQTKISSVKEVVVS